MNGNILKGNRSRIGRESYQFYNKSKGFTLVELIVVLVVLSILAALVVPLFIGFIDKARDREDIADAEKSLSVTQTVLNEVYNDGGNQVHPSRRAKAEADSGVGAGTKFKVWTKAQLADGVTPATSDYLASYLVEYAQFTAKNGKEYYYDGSGWSESAATGEAGNVIYMWGYTGGDTAYNPSSVVYDDDIIDNPERDINDFDVTITLADSNGLGLTFTHSGSSSYTETFNGNVFSIPEFDLGIAYDKSSVSWRYGGNEYKTSEEITAYLRTLRSNADIVMVAEARPNYIEIPVTFSAYNGDTLRVEPTAGSPENLKLKIALTAPDTFVTNIPDTPVSCNKNTDSANIFFNCWACGDATFNNVAAAVANARATALDLAAQCIAQNAMVDGIPSSLDYVAYAGTNKTIYAWAKEGQTNYIYFGDEDNDQNRSRSFLLTSYERIQDGKAIYYSGTKVYDADTNQIMNGFDISSGLHIKNNKNIKFWHLFDCIVNGGSKSNEETARNTFNEDLLARLFGADGANLYYVLAEIELTGDTTMLAYQLNNANATPVAGYLSRLANGSMTNILNVYFVSPGDKPNYNSKHRELCISTTTLETESEYLLKQVNGEYVVDVLDEDYPSYTVAYSVRSGTKYNIYIFTEDGSGVAAKGSLKDMFKGCTSMVNNTLLGNMSTEQVTGTTSMFESCTNMVVSVSSGSSLMNTENVTAMDRMFYGCTKLQTVELGLNTAKATTMKEMFYNCKDAKTTNPVTIRLDAASDISSMFAGCGSTSGGPIDVTFIGKGNSADTPSALGNNSTTDIFKSSKIRNLELHNLYLPNISGDDASDTNRTATPNTANGLYKLTQSGIGTLERVTFEEVTVPNLHTVNSLFLNGSNLVYADVSGLCVPNNDNIRRMFSKCSKLTNAGIVFKKGDKNFFQYDADGKCKILNAATAFSVTSLTTTEIEGLDTSNCKYVDWLFEDCAHIVEAPEVHIDNAQTMQKLFNGCTSLTSVTLVGSGTNSVPIGDTSKELGRDVFLNCNSLESLTIRGEGPDQIQTFSGCITLKGFCPATVHTFRMENLIFTRSQALTEWFKNDTAIKEFTMDNVELTVSKISGAFYGCSNLETADFGEKINTAAVDDMSNVFYGCFKLEELDVTGFNTKKVTTYAGMFESCYSLTELDISSFDITSITFGSKFLDMFGTNLDYNGSHESSLTTIYATPGKTEAGSGPSAATDRRVFGNGLVNLVGGRGTTMESVRQDPRLSPASGVDAASLPTYMKIDDGTKAGMGYFTDIADK